MILSDFDTAAADMATVRTFLPILNFEVPVSADNELLYRMRDGVHRDIGCVLRVREGIAARDGSQTFATAMTTVKAAQGAADDLVAELDRVRVEIMRAFPVEAAARMGRVVSACPAADAGFSGFASSAGA